MRVVTEFVNQMVIKNKHSHESFDTSTLSSEMVRKDELIVDLDGFEGPLDLLLTLSRSQKLDLMKISILQLAEQYLDFVEKARALKIDRPLLVQKWWQGGVAR